MEYVNEQLPVRDLIELRESLNHAFLPWTCPDPVQKERTLMEMRRSIYLLYTIKDVKEPVKDQDELALVEVTVDEDPLKLRRRIREKTSVACLKTYEEEEEEKRRVNLFRVLYDEEQHLLGSEPREVPALQRG